MKRLAVLGRPIAHSLSPRMHSAAFAELGLADEWSYEAIELAPAELEEGIGRLRERGFVGANVTIPHKEAALALADSASEAARRIGAANTLSFTGDGVVAENTDAPGLLAALGESPAGRRALVLGAGGAARAVVWALRDAGAEVEVCNRTASRAAALVEELGAARALGEGESPRLERYGLLVNATSLGLEEAADPASTSAAVFKAFGFSADQLTKPQVVADLAYGEAETGLIKAARAAGARTVDGTEILVQQGAASFAIWTGLSPPLEAMRHAVGKPPDGARRHRSSRSSSPGPRTGGGGAG